MLLQKKTEADTNVSTSAIVILLENSYFTNLIFTGITTVGVL